MERTHLEKTSYNYISSLELHKKTQHIKMEVQNICFWYKQNFQWKYNAQRVPMHVRRQCTQTETIDNLVAHMECIMIVHVCQIMLELYIDVMHMIRRQCVQIETIHSNRSHGRHYDRLCFSAYAWIVDRPCLSTYAWIADRPFVNLCLNCLCISIYERMKTMYPNWNQTL